MTKVKYCIECKYSATEKDASWNLRCRHPAVNKEDPWALSASSILGTDCRAERQIKWFGVCGRSGKKWEEKIFT